MNNLIAALIKAKGEFTPILKNKINPFHKSKYADLDSVIDAVTPALCNHGLAIIQLVQIVDGKSVLETCLYHDSGEHISSIYPLPDVSDSQKFGASITYARRYALSAMLSIAPDSDDDGNSTSGENASKPAVKAKSEEVHPQDAKIKAIRTMTNYPVEEIKAYLAFHKADRPSQLTPDIYYQLIDNMCMQWALNSGKFSHPNHAQNSYEKNVISARDKGMDTIPAIKAWMESKELIPA